LVEHATENRSVGGSIPPLGTIPQIVGQTEFDAGDENRIGILIETRQASSGRADWWDEQV
jgi:hypothetical protein